MLVLGTIIHQYHMASYFSHLPTSMQELKTLLHNMQNMKPITMRTCKQKSNMQRTFFPFFIFPHEDSSSEAVRYIPSSAIFLILFLYLSTRSLTRRRYCPTSWVKCNLNLYKYVLDFWNKGNAFFYDTWRPTCLDKPLDAFQVLKNLKYYIINISNLQT